MEIKFISEFGILELSGIKISIQESNSKTADTMFTKFTLPFDVYADPEFLRKFGDYTSNESNNLKNKISGFLQIENRLHDAVLFIQKIKGYNITAQIDFGFEELPNFDKKLSELPLESFDVPDIHTYSKDIAAKTWPYTNFNFPRVYSKKYSPDQTMWSSFDGYYNDLKADGSEMRRNYVDSNGNIFNINIIHPMVHPLYILQKGFDDAGLELEGDILTDPVLLKKWVFSGTEYFSKVNQYSNEKYVRSNEYSSSEWKYNVNAGKYMLYTYGTSENLAFQDKVYINVTFTARIFKFTTLKFKVRVNGNDIFSFEESFNETKTVTKTFQTSIDVNNANLSFHVEGALHSLNESYEVIKYELKSNSIITTSGETQSYDNSLVNNVNKIDLKKAVPDMTFGEYFNRLKNWLNYDLEIIDKRAIMNRISVEEITDVKDFSQYETANPQRTFLNKKSWLLKFADLDNGDKKDSMYYDSNGPKINGKENKETNIIEIDGYVLPVKLPKPNGHNTAYVLKDSSTTLALVDYDGLKNGQNNANAASDCDFPALFESHWRSWLKMRLNGQEFEWSSYVVTNQFYYHMYSIKNYIYAYNNVHIVKSWTKEKVSPTIYNVTFITETVS